MIKILFLTLVVISLNITALSETKKRDSDDPLAGIDFSKPLTQEDYDRILEKAYKSKKTKREVKQYKPEQKPKVITKAWAYQQNQKEAAKQKEYKLAQERYKQFQKQSKSLDKKIEKAEKQCDEDASKCDEMMKLNDKKINLMCKLKVNPEFCKMYKEMIKKQEK